MQSVLDFLGPKPANVLVPAALFALLMPGMLVNFSILDPFSTQLMQMNGAPLVVLMSHALVFAIVYATLRKQFAYVY
jgi:hypothetical protein